MHFLFFLSLAFVCLVQADFYVFEYAADLMAGIKFLSMPEPTCPNLAEAHAWDFSWDVSGNKQGCRIVRGSDRKAAPEVLECNTDFGHFTIYKDRNWGIFDLDDKQHGSCQPYTDFTFDCSSGIMGDNRGQSLFHCNTDIGTN